MKVFVSWSGGKESALSCYRAMQRKDLEVTHLLNMVSEDGIHSRSHGVKAELLEAQAKAMGLPILQKRCTWDTYEEAYKNAVAELKREGIEGGIFGDIDLQPHRDWVERVSAECGIKAILPLWGGERESLITEFIEAGFAATVVSVKPEALGPEWIGRKLDRAFVEEIKKLGNIDLCGEAGEYHTLVTGGPIFS